MSPMKCLDYWKKINECSSANRGESATPNPQRVGDADDGEAAWGRGTDLDIT